MTSPTSDDAAPEGTAAVTAALVGWREQLTGVGGPNALLWFQALGSGTLHLTSAHPAGVAKVLAGHAVLLSEAVRSSDAFADAVRRARAIRRTALRLERERGLRTCYLAIGMATWDVPDRYPRPPAAPALLRRATLRPTDAEETDFHLDLESEPIANPVLQEYLRSTRGIEVDPDALAGAARNGSPEGAYELLRTACERIPGFDVRPSLVVSTFSTVKSSAINDLTEPDELGAHPVLAALAGDPEAQEAVSAQAPAPPEDPDLAAERIVLDADATQHAVIDAVREGSHLVVNGPPGTGKSQTAANLAASLTSEGRRVLVVAEKRAALETVRRRLDAVGLADLVLDPWDGQSLTGLQRTLREVPRAESTGETAELPPALGSAQEHLADHRRAMHVPRDPWGVSVDQAQTRISELAALPNPPHSRVRLVGTHLHHIPAERLDEIRARLVAVAEAGAWTTAAGGDPWYGARVVGEDQTRRVRDLVRRLADGGLAAYRARVGDLATQVSLKRPRTVLEADEQLDLMGRVFATLEIFRQPVFETPLDDLVAATARRSSEGETQMGMFERRRLRAQARELLRPGPPPRDLHGVLLRAADQKQQWRERSGRGSVPSAPVEVPDVEREHEEFREELEWLAARLEPTAQGGDLIRADLDDLQRRLERLAAADDRLSAVPRTVNETDALRREHLGPLLDDFAAHRLPVERVPEELDFVWWSSVLDEIKSRDPSYAAHDGDGLRRVRATYERTDRAHLERLAEQVGEEIASRVRQAVSDFPDQAELLFGVASDRPVPWRWLLEQAPELLTIARPCWVMSPHEVASLVPPGMWFDVVIIDEGSQLPTASAVSAISRGEQVVVLGDPKQQAPTSFAVSGDAPQHAPAGDSVLDALLPLLPQHTLTWHYRSADERLVAFANAQTYAGSLVTLPSTHLRSPVRLEIVDGARGNGATNAAEVDHVITLLREQVQERPDETVAVVAFADEHVVAIETALRQAATQDAALATALDADEPLAVWSSDAAQGQERDAVIVSVGSGRDADGAVTHRFGSLGDEGGEQRLTVAVTRARRRMTVVSSVGAADLVPAKLRSRGAQMLRDLLVYAAGENPEQASGDRAGGVTRIGGRRRRTASTGSVLDRPLQPGAGSRPASSVVADLARRLRSKGLVVHEQFGRSVLPLDLVVADPARPDEPLVAVETDGPTFGAITGVRDRDRLRPERLRALGWAYERVWTVDVFRDPARDVARIQSLVEQLSRERGVREHPERIEPGDGLEQSS